MRAFNHHIHRKFVSKVCNLDQDSRYNCALIAIVLILSAIMVWSFWPVIADLVKTWQTNDDYSAGQLIPIIVLFLVWRERKSLAQCTLTPCWLGGISLLLLAQAARVFGLLTFRASPERYSLILAIAGSVLMVAGWQVLRKVLWILLFLFLMVPLPGRVDNLISGPLQNMATTGSVFLLEALGATVSQQGNVVMLNENTPMAVAEACSGLRMLTAFVVVAAFMAYMVKRSRLKKAVLLVSSIPVAVMCNILRLCVTGVLFMVASSEVAEKFFHDFAGLAMMPAAVLLMFGELWLMDKIILPETYIRQDSERAKSVPKTQVKRKKRTQTA
jgi:exosortase